MGESLLVRKAGGGAKVNGNDKVYVAQETINAGDFITFHYDGSPSAVDTISPENLVQYKQPEVYDIDFGTTNTENRQFDIIQYKPNIFVLSHPSGNNVQFWTIRVVEEKTTNSLKPWASNDFSLPTGITSQIKFVKLLNIENVVYCMSYYFTAQNRLFYALLDNNGVFHSNSTRGRDNFLSTQNLTANDTYGEWLDNAVFEKNQSGAIIAASFNAQSGLQRHYFGVYTQGRSIFSNSSNVTTEGSVLLNSQNSNFATVSQTVLAYKAGWVTATDGGTTYPTAGFAYIFFNAFIQSNTPTTLTLRTYSFRENSNYNTILQDGTITGISTSTDISVLGLNGTKTSNAFPAAYSIVAYKDGSNFLTARIHRYFSEGSSLATPILIPNVVVDKHFQLASLNPIDYKIAEGIDDGRNKNVNFENKFIIFYTESVSKNVKYAIYQIGTGYSPTLTLLENETLFNASGSGQNVERFRFFMVDAYKGILFYSQAGKLKSRTITFKYKVKKATSISEAIGIAKNNGIANDPITVITR
jgi:uncharacterized protein YccT (UPF0319 family)